MTEEERAFLRRISEDKTCLEVARRAIEDVLVDWRDSRLSELGRNNGLVINEKDGRQSNVIRFGSEAAMKIGLRAIADSFDGAK